MGDRAAFFLSRQPIVAADRRFVGWELVLGSGEGQPLASDSRQADAHHDAMQRIAKSADWESLLCGGRALLRVDRRHLFGDLFEQLPRNKFLLGLEPGFEVDANLTTRLHTLHRQRGTRLLLQGYARRDAREALIEITDAVEVDVGATDEDVDMLVRRAHRRKLEVLGQSIDTEAVFVRTREMGLDLFQGLHYAEAGSQEETGANVQGRLLLELLLDTRRGLDIDTASKRIEGEPALAEALLRLVNSLELARAQKIESVGQALIMIGADGVARWLNLLLFQVGVGSGHRGPLFRVAASRARLMELLVCQRAGDDPETKQLGETAFLVGILSLVHVLLGTDRAGALDGLALPDDVAAALGGHGGELGRLLRLAECLDAAAFPELAALCDELSIEPAALWESQREAYEWVQQML